MRELADAGARDRAVSDFASNLVVVAGAGTGKTSLLVERLLSAVSLGVAGLEQVAAITFTDKAAGEMRERLGAGLERLRALASGEEPPGGGKEADRVHLRLSRPGSPSPEVVAARSLEALEGLERARVTTIHAFCADLLREYPVQARLAPDFQVDDGERAAGLFESEWTSFVATELGTGAPRAAAWRALLQQESLGTVREVARQAAGFGIPGSLLEDPEPPSTHRLFRAAAEGLARDLSTLLQRQSGMSDLPRAYLEAAAAALEAFASDGLDALRTACARRPVLDRGDPPAPNARLRQVEPEVYRSVTKEAHRLLRGLRELDEPLFDRLLEVVRPFVSGFRETLLRRGIVTFDGLLALARDLLREHPEVRERLKRRYRMLLLDEFQDTDPLQYEIVLFLAEVAGGRARDAYAAELEPGRLFVVGDPKQSIYRFRGADYAAFVRAVERIAPDPRDRLHLVVNFRGVSGVIDPVNRLLAAPDSVWQAGDYQPDYESIRPYREVAAGKPRVEVWTVSAGAGARERRMIEGECVAAAIHRMVAAGECGYGDVMILLRAFTHLPLYLRPLRRWGIPFVVDGGRELLERTEVVQLLAVLRALARPADPVALLGFLRSPAGGVTDTELAAYAGSGRWDWREPVDRDAHPQIHRAFGLLQRVAASTRDCSADAVLRRLVEETYLVPLAAFGYEGAQRVANLRKITMAAVELAREGRLTLNEILDALERERIADLEGESPLADETWGSVRVLTVHKAKGLQNEVVFLPDLAREPAVRQPEVEVRLVHPPGGATLAVQLGRRGNAAGLWRIAEEERHESAEEIRTLYVALTRAEERIVLVAGRSRRTAAWIEALRSWGYDPEAPPPDGATLDPGVVHRVVTPGTAPPPAVRQAPVRTGDALRRWDRAVTLLRIAPPPFARPSGLREADEVRRESVTEGLPVPRARRARGRARAVGRTVHRALEIWESGRDRDLLGSVPPLARDAAAEEGIRSDEVEVESREVLLSFLASPLASRLREVTVLGREVPTLHADPSGTTWRGSIDLLFRDGDRVVIADYKTDPDERGALSRHGPQLRAYVEAVRRALDLAEPPRAELWMLRQGSILVLEEEPGPTRS